MCSWHTGVPIWFWWLLSQHTLEGKRGNPSVIFLMLGREKLLPLRAHPSHGHGHSPDPSVQLAQVLPSVLSSLNVTGDMGGLQPHDAPSPPHCRFCPASGPCVPVPLPTAAQPIAAWPYQASVMLRVPSRRVQDSSVSSRQFSRQSCLLKLQFTILSSAQSSKQHTDTHTQRLTQRLTDSDTETCCLQVKGPTLGSAIKALTDHTPTGQPKMHTCPCALPLTIPLLPCGDLFSFLNYNPKCHLSFSQFEHIPPNLL